MPVVEKLEFDVNESPQVTIVITSDGTSRGTPQNITGWSLRAVIHEEPGDNTPVKTYTSPSAGISITDGAAGKFTWTIPKADLEELGVDTKAYYVERTDLGAEADLRKGDFVINAV